jgi:hypothetical protein
MPAQSPITEWFVTGETSAGIPEALAQEAASSSSRGRVRESEDELANLRDEKTATSGIPCYFTVLPSKISAFPPLILPQSFPILFSLRNILCCFPAGLCHREDCPAVNTDISGGSDRSTV